jgi:general secretion pathway protein A
MYKGFFGFKEPPFDLSPNPRTLVLTEGHAEAIKNIEYGIASRKGITLLVGPAGVGKTTVIRAAIERLPAPVHCVYLHNPALTRPEFIELLAAQFSLSPKAQESKATLLMELEALLRRRHSANEMTALIIDEAQSLPLTLLEEVRLLANIETTEQKLISVVLAGQPQLAKRLDDPSMSQFKQRVALWSELRPLTFNETAAYVLGRIQSAGGIAGGVFTIQAVTLMHEAARGIPRIINVIADNALVRGFSAQQRPVNAQIVQQVCRDLRIKQDGAVSWRSSPTEQLAGGPEDVPAGHIGSTPEEETSVFPLPPQPRVGAQSESSTFARVPRRTVS